MRLPAGRLVRSRVVTDPRTALIDALDRELTGYAVFEPQEALLLDGDQRGILTFRAGVPVAAYHTGADRGGPPALADLAATGPYRLELFALPPDDLTDVHGVESFRVPPGMPAERLAGDQALADRTRGAAPADREQPRRSGVDDEAGDRVDRTGAVEAFLEDTEKIEAIREQARAEARERAEQWGFETEAAGGDTARTGSSEPVEPNRSGSGAPGSPDRRER